jgi:hypothetical protein
VGTGGGFVDLASGVGGALWAFEAGQHSNFRCGFNAACINSGSPNAIF